MNTTKNRISTTGTPRAKAAGPKTPKAGTRKVSTPTTGTPGAKAAGPKTPMAGTRKVNAPGTGASRAKMPETIRVVVPAASLLDVMRRYRKITWPVTVTIRDRGTGGTLLLLRNRGELEHFRDRACDLQVAYFRKVRGELFLDLSGNATLTVRYRTFRRAGRAGLLVPTETVRYFLYRTGDLKEPEKEDGKPAGKAPAVRL